MTLDPYNSKIRLCVFCAEIQDIVYDTGKAAGEKKTLQRGRNGGKVE